MVRSAWALGVRPLLGKTADPDRHGFETFDQSTDLLDSEGRRTHGLIIGSPGPLDELFLFVHTYQRGIPQLEIRITLHYKSWSQPRLSICRDTELVGGYVSLRSDLSDIYIWDRYTVTIYISIAAWNIAPQRRKLSNK